MRSTTSPSQTRDGLFFDSSFSFPIMRAPVQPSAWEAKNKLPARLSRVDFMSRSRDSDVVEVEGRSRLRLRRRRRSRAAEKSLHRNLLEV